MKPWHLRLLVATLVIVSSTACWAQADQSSNLPAALKRAAVHSDRRALNRLLKPAVVAPLNECARSDLVTELILNNDLDGLTRAVRSGVSANQTIYVEVEGDLLQVSALNYAIASTADLRVALHLIDLGADVNAMARDDDPPLHTAIKTGRLGLVEPLLARGAKADGREPLFGATPLMRLLHVERDMRRAEPVAIALLDHGDRIDSTTPAGLTALMFVASDGNESGARWLLAHGADPRAVASNGDTALSLAKRVSLIDTSTVAQLLESRDTGATSTRELP